MKPYDPRRPEAVLAAAALTLAAGGWLMFGTLMHAREVRTRVRSIRRAVETVAEARAAIGEADAIVSVFSTGAQRGETPAALHRHFLPDTPPEFVDQGAPAPTPAGPLRRREWRVDDAAADQVLAFASACESARPPWRIEAIRLYSVPGTEGRVRGEMVLEGMDP